MDGNGKTIGDGVGVADKFYGEGTANLDDFSRLYGL